VPSWVLEVVLEAVGLQADSLPLFHLRLLLACSRFLCDGELLLGEAVSNTTILKGTQFAVLQGNLVDDDRLPVVDGPWLLLVDVAPLACSDDLAVAQVDFA